MLIIDDILFVLSLLSQDFFTAFGLYSLFFLIIRLFWKSSKLNQIDSEACQFISFIGIAFLAVWLLGITSNYHLLSENSKVANLNKMFGKYWFGFWTQPLLWVLLTQLLRVEKLRKYTLTRLFFSLFLLLSIEKMIILSTSLHRDYLPSSYIMFSELELSPFLWALALFGKIAVFLLVVSLYKGAGFILAKWRHNKNQ